MSFFEEDTRSETDSLLEKIGHLSRSLLEVQEKVKNRKRTPEEEDLENIKIELDSMITRLISTQRSASSSSFAVPPENSGLKYEYPELGIKLSRSEGSVLVPELDIEKLRQEIDEEVFVDVTDITPVVNEKKMLKAIKNNKITLSQLARCLNDNDEIRRRKTTIKVTPIKENEE